MRVLIINGPNLNVLEKREKNHYPNTSLTKIKTWTNNKLKKFKCSLKWYQSNSESEIVSRIHKMHNEKWDLLVINPAAYSHTSVAILDALLTLKIPIIEVHLSNTLAREYFRHDLLTARAAKIIMKGLGGEAYYWAIMTHLKESK